MTWQEALQQYYANGPGMDDSKRAWLQKNVDLDAPLLVEETQDGLIALFAKDGELNHTRLLRTLVWQTFGQILAGERAKFTGNLRSFWYEVSQPLYHRTGLFGKILEMLDLVDVPRWFRFWQEQEDSKDDRGLTAKAKYINKTGETVFHEFVKQRIFRYQDIGFRDKTAHLKLIGGGYASLIFFVEKEGLFEKYCQTYYDKYHISVIAGNGFPSAIGMEYFSDQLRAKKIKNVGLAGATDYDPFGTGIFNTYVDFFTEEGFGIKSATILTTPELFTEKALAEESVDLDAEYPHKKTQIDAWMAITNGIHGLRRGIHVDAASSPRMHKKVDQWYKAQTE